MKTNVRKIKNIVTYLIILALLALTFGFCLAFTRTAKADSEPIILDAPADEGDPDSYLTEIWNDQVDVSSNVEVKLCRNWTVNEPITVSENSNVILDLNGYTINGSYSVTVITVEGSLEIIDGKVSGLITEGYSDSDGGGIYVNGGALTMRGGTVSGNSAYTGGGIYVNGGTFTMYGGTVSGNEAQNVGGGIYLNGGTFTMYGGTISGNTATGNGGGIYAANNSTLTVSDDRGVPVISGNSAYDGGGVCISVSTFNFNGGQIYNNNATNNGGGICSDGELIIGGGSVNLNTAGNWGGAIWSGGDLYLNKGDIYGNTANEGGGIYSAGEVFEIAGGSVNKNTAKNGDGGGIYVGNTVSVRGATTVKDNFGSGDNSNNLYLPVSISLTVCGSLEGSEIYVTLDSYYGDAAFTSHYSEYNSQNTYYPNDPDNYFKSDSGLFTAIDSDREVKFTGQENKWQVSIDNGVYEDAGYGVTLTYGAEVTGIKLNDQYPYESDEYTHDYVEAGVYEFGKAYGLLFTIVINRADVNGAITVDFDNDGIKPTNNKYEYLMVGEFTNPDITVSINGNVLIIDEDYEITTEYSGNKATITISGTGNYEGQQAITIYVIDSEDEYDEYCEYRWEFYNAETDSWQTDLPYFVYNGRDMKAYVRVAVRYKRVTADNFEGEFFEEVITYSNGVRGWSLSIFNEAGTEVNQFITAGKYTFKLEGEDYASREIEISKAECTDETILGADFGKDNGNWLVHVGEQDDHKTTYLMDGSEVAYVTASGVAAGISGQAYAYMREDGSGLVIPTIALNADAESGAGKYIYSFDGNYVTVAYTSTTEESEYITKITTTAKVTFDNYYFILNGEKSDYIEIVKEWYVVTAANGLWTFSETAKSYEQIIENGKYCWEYGDVHDNGIFSYVFRPAHGEYAFYTISGSGVNESFAVRFTDNVTSFWTYTDGYIVGNRILDKHFLYDYLEALNAGNYEIALYIPRTSTTNTYKLWWDGDKEVVDYGVIYAEMKFTFSIEIEAYSLPQSVELKNNNGIYTFSDGNLTISYAKLIEAEYGVPFVTVNLKGKTLYEEYDYEITASTAQTQDGIVRSFVLSAVEGGNLSGAITSATVDGKISAGLPFEIKTLANGFEALSIIAWKYQSYDSAINLITVKAVAGTVTLYLHANNPTVLSDDEVVDNISDKILISFGEISTDAYGNVKLGGDFADKLKTLDAGTYWLRAVATDENGIYETAEREVKFIILRAENRWSVIPGVVSWRYDEYDAAVNVVSGEPLYGSAIFSVYKLESDKTYSLLSFNGVTEFKLEEVGDFISSFESGTYYLCARVDGTNNYSGLNERVIGQDGVTEDYTDEEISRFPSFNVFDVKNSWSALPSLLGWTYRGYNEAVNVIKGTPAHGFAEFSILDSSLTPLKFNGLTTFTLSTDGEVPYPVVEVLKDLNAGTYYLRAVVMPTPNYTGLDVSVSFIVAKYDNFWTETPNLPSWKWKEYDSSFNIIRASSASDEAPVVFRITYIENGFEKALTFDGSETFTLDNGVIPDYVQNVLGGLTAGVTYRLYASVSETANYTELEEVYATFDVIRQTNYWQTSPNAVSWKWKEYDAEINAINALPAYGEASVTVYRNVDGEYKEVDLDGLSDLDAGVYYICAVVEGTANYSGLNDGIVDFSRLPTFSVTSVNNYWRVIPFISDWKWDEYDSAVNAVFAEPAYGDKVEFSIYSVKNGIYSKLSFDGKETFVLTDGKVPEAVEAVLKNLDSGTYYLRAYVAGTVNYSGLNEQTENISSYTVFHVLSVTNYWLVTPNVVSWRYGEFDPAVNVKTAIPAHGNVSFTVYREENGVFVSIDVDSIGLDKLGAGTYYLRATVAGTVNYSGINENLSQSDIAELTKFSVIKVQNQWEDVPSLVGWSEGQFDATVNKIVGSSRHGEVKFTVTDENGKEMDISQLDKLGIGTYILNAYVDGNDNYFELSASTTFVVFEDSLSLSRIVAATIVFAVIAIVLAVVAILLLVRRNKKIAKEFMKVIRLEIKDL